MRPSHSQPQQHSYASITLPQIKISDFEDLLKPAGKRVSDDWETGVKKLGSLPGYKYSASMSLASLGVPTCLVKSSNRNDNSITALQLHFHNFTNFLLHYKKLPIDSPFHLLC